MNTQEQARALMMRHHQFIKNRQQSMLGRANAEIGLDIDNALQGQPSSSTRFSYDRSNASLS